MKVETETVLVNLRNVQKYRLTVGFWFSAFQIVLLARMEGPDCCWYCPSCPLSPLTKQCPWFAGAEFFSEDITRWSPALIVLLKVGH